MNKVILIGRLARDPEMRTTTSGTNVTNFTVAVSRPKIDGEDRGADFINCIAWRHQAENIAKYCTKGSQVAIDGRVQVTSFEGQDGTRKYKTNIVADSVMFLGSRPQSGQESGQQFNSNQEAFDSAMSDKEDPFMNFGSQIELDDSLELPF